MRSNCLILICLLLGLNVAEATVTRKLIEYEMGNQITRTGVLVLSNGLIMQTRSHIGKTEYLDDQQLDHNDLVAMVKDIETLASSSRLQKDDIPATMGGAYGHLTVYTKDGGAPIVYGLYGGTANVKTLICQEGAAADEVRTFIQNLVRDQMPLDVAPCR